MSYLLFLSTDREQSTRWGTGRPAPIRPGGWPVTAIEGRTPHPRIRSSPRELVVLLGTDRRAVPVRSSGRRWRLMAAAHADGLRGRGRGVLWARNNEGGEGVVVQGGEVQRTNEKAIATKLCLPTCMATASARVTWRELERTVAFHLYLVIIVQLLIN
jgi:hypothetical protein